MIEIWIDEESGRVEITVRGEAIKLSRSEAVRLRDGLSDMFLADERYVR